MTHTKIMSRTKGSLQLQILSSTLWERAIMTKYMGLLPRWVDDQIQNLIDGTRARLAGWFTGYEWLSDYRDAFSAQRPLGFNIVLAQKWEYLRDSQRSPASSLCGFEWRTDLQENLYGPIGANQSIRVRIFTVSKYLFYININLHKYVNLGYIIFLLDLYFVIFLLDLYFVISELRYLGEWFISRFLLGNVCLQVEFSLSSSTPGSHPLPLAVILLAAYYTVDLIDRMGL